MTSPLRIYIGWDAREPIAYDVAKFSLERRASIPVEITPIKLDDLRARRLYWRDTDPLASTEFTYSRFLTPALASFRGWALFIDCDFLWLGDIAGLADYMRVPKAVYCVQHDYRPKETTKMDGAVQAAVWDRLLGLPVDFFRRFTVGDLLGRSMGVDAMRELLTGHVVTSILAAFWSGRTWARTVPRSVSLAR